MTGKCLVSLLFFVGNHPFYRKVCLYFDYDLAQMPEFMLDQVKNTVGVLIEGQGSVNDYCGENFDFKLENTNKQVNEQLIKRLEVDNGLENENENVLDI